MPFEHNLHPIIVSLGPLAIRWYSLVWILGFLLAYWLLLRAARAGRIKKLDDQGADRLITWLIVGTVAGARLFYVFAYNLPYFIESPLKVFAVWEGGLAFHGGFIGAFIAIWWFCKREKLDFWRIADFLVVPLALMLVFGRIANFINAELVGTLSDVAWCVNYPNQWWIEGCRHPSQLYEALKNLIVFAVVAPFFLREDWYVKLKRGTVLWLFLLLYGLGRLITDIWREPDPAGAVWATTRFLSLSFGQWLSVVFMLVSGALLLWWYFGPKRTE